MDAVVLVDDDVLFRTIVRDALEDQRPHGVHRIIEAGTAEEALERLDVTFAMGETAFLLTDYRLPEMDGMDLVRTAAATHPGLRAAVWTSHSDILDRSRAMVSGAAVIESKPMTPEGLRLMLARLLAPPRPAVFEIA